MEEQNKYTVYIHISPSTKKYIGITSQKPISRWGKNGQNYKNRYFKNAIQKYGWENFKHEILFEKLNQEEAKAIEIKLIEQYNTTDRLYGYNISKGGDTGNGLSGINHPLYGIHKLGKNSPNYGKHHSQISKDKISEAHKLMIGELNPFYGKHHSDETKEKIRNQNKGRFIGKENPRAKPVICLETGIIYDTVKIAADENNLHSGNIVNSCEMKRNKTGNLHWQYLQDYKNGIKIDILKNVGNSKKILCVETGIVYDSIKQASVDIGVDTSGISKVCSGTRKLAGGYHFKYTFI